MDHLRKAINKEVAKRDLEFKAKELAEFLKRNNIRVSTEMVAGMEVLVVSADYLGETYKEYVL